jgi:hypothetical protein
VSSESEIQNQDPTPIDTTLPTEGELDALDVEPAGEAPPVLIPVAEKPKKKKESGAARRKRKAGGAVPDVAPPPADFAPPPPFEGGPPASSVPDVEPPPREEPATPAKVARRRRPIDPKAAAQKMAGGADKIASAVASARYKDRAGAPLVMPQAILASLGFKVDPKSTELVPIAEAARMTEEERKEIEAGIQEVLEESPIFVTGPQALLFAAVMMYGTKIYAMESIATQLYKKPNGDNK